MIKRKVHMCDQVTNRIELIMQERRFSLLHQLEEFSIALLLVSVFLVGVGL